MKSRITPLSRTTLYVASCLLTLCTARGAEPVPAKPPAGKLDGFVSKTESGSATLNGMYWTPNLKAGALTIDPPAGNRTSALGAFLRVPAKSQTPEFIVGAQALDIGPLQDHEVQAEMRLKSGFGIGAGTVERETSIHDVDFVKASARFAVGRFNVISTIQGYRQLGDTGVGGYAAIHDKHLMAAAGFDAEQWRVVGALIAPAPAKGWWRPAVECMFVDNEVGKLRGPKALVINGTLGFRGGFLDHPARLGRAMGPSGLEMGNPLGFIAPTWNRKLSVWELGDMVNFRLERNEFADRTVARNIEATLDLLRPRMPVGVDRVFVLSRQTRTRQKAVSYATGLGLIAKAKGGFTMMATVDRDNAHGNLSGTATFIYLLK